MSRQRKKFDLAIEKLMKLLFNELSTADKELIYLELMRLQLGRCAICGKHQLDLDRKLVIDHNHQTGKIRGLLCQSCNIRLSYLERKLNHKFAHLTKIALKYMAS